MPHITLSFTTSVFVVLFLVLIAVTIAIFFYRNTIPPIARGKKIFLIVLRSLALALLLMFLFEPLLRFISTSTQKPVLAVLIDNSTSMTIKDKSGDRKGQLTNLLTGDGLQTAAGEVRYYTFGLKAQPVETLHADSLGLSEEATDITAALRKLAEEKERLNVGAAVILTDGSYNLGVNPVYEAEQLGIPLFSIGIGDSTEQKDVVLTKIASNELVYSQTEVPVDVTIKSAGYNGEKVEVILAEGSKELTRAQVLLQEGTREYGVRLTYRPDGEGVKKYSVNVSRLHDELTTANNRRTFLARILKNKLRILLIAGTPSPDVSIIKQTLREDANFDVRVLTQKSPSSFFEGMLTAQAIDSSDCIVLIGFPIASTTEATLDLLKSSISKTGIPLMFVSGKTIDARKLSALSALLPCESSNPLPNEQLVFIEPTAAQMSHPILATNTEEGAESWKRLPPIYRTQTVYKAKAEAVVLASTKINSIVLNEPLVAIRSVNKQKSLAILGYGVWRWRLMAQGTPQTEKLFSMLLSNSIRWLTTREDNRPVKVTPTKDAFTQGEPIEFVGQVYDANANPVESAELKLVAQQQGKEVETTLRPIGNGRYEGTLEGLASGDYTFRASANTDGQPLGEDKGRFSVGELALEFQDTRMNVQLLRQLAVRTGGGFYTPATFNGMANTLSSQASFVPREVQQTREVELWNWKYMLALVVLLLAVEWFVRKRSGML